MPSFIQGIITKMQTQVNEVLVKFDKLKNQQ